MFPVPISDLKDNAINLLLGNLFAGSILSLKCRASMWVLDLLDRSVYVTCETSHGHKLTTEGLEMKMVVREVEKEGLENLLGKRVTLFCGVYIYTGELVGVNDTCVKLHDAKVVYETGAFSDKDWKDAQKIGDVWYVQCAAIESFGILK